MSKKIAIFLNRDFEIRDLKFIIKKLLTNKFSIDVYYQKTTKDKDSFKYAGVANIIKEFSRYENFKFENKKFSQNSLLKISRLIFSMQSYFEREKVFDELKIRFAKPYLFLKIFLKFEIIFKRKLFKNFFLYFNYILEKLSFNYDLKDFILKKKYNSIIITSLLLDPTLSQNEIIKISHVLKIPCIYLVRSWDNLSNKSSMNIFPDHVFLWNESQVHEIKNIQKNDVTKCHIIGAHLYEYLLHNETKDEIEDLKCLETDKKIITYLGSSSQIVADELEFFYKFLQKIDPNILNDYQIIYRSHPLGIGKSQTDQIKNKIDKIKNYKVKFIPELDNISNFHNKILDKKLYTETIKKSDLLIGINTSAMIEANFFNKKVIQVPSNFEHNVSGLFNNTYHSKYLGSGNQIAGAIKPINLKHFEELLKLNDPKNKKLGQNYNRDFAKNFLNLEKFPSENIFNILKKNLEKRIQFFPFQISYLEMFFRKKYSIKYIIIKTIKHLIAHFNFRTKIKRNLYTLILKILGYTDYKQFTIPFALFSKKKKEIIYLVHPNFGHKIYDMHYLNLKLMHLKSFKLNIYNNNLHEFYYVPVFKKIKKDKLLSSGDKRIVNINLNKKIFYQRYKNLFYNFIYKLIKERDKFYDLDWKFHHSKWKPDTKKYYIRKFFQNQELRYDINDDSKILAKSFLSKLNIKNRKIILIYVRNTKYYEHINRINLKNPNLVEKNLIFSDHFRNFSAETYRTIIKKYEKEFFFIKLGFKDCDKTLDKYNFENYYDLSNEKKYSTKLELYLIANCHLGIVPESGTEVLFRLYKKPLLRINNTNPIMSYPTMSFEMSLMQKNYLHKLGRYAKLDDYFTLDVINFPRSEKIHDFKKNSHEEIEFAFYQLLKKIENNFEMSEKDVELKNKILPHLANYRSKNRRYKKWFYEDGWIGDGTLLDINL